MYFVLISGFADTLTDLGIDALSSDKDSASGSQNDLCKIPSLPTPADFLSPADSAIPKLMTPDAFMTPSASVSLLFSYGISYLHVGFLSTSLFFLYQFLFRYQPHLAVVLAAWL